MQLPGPVHAKLLDQRRGEIDRPLASACLHVHQVESPIGALELPAATTDAILGGTAARLLGLDGARAGAAAGATALGHQGHA